MVKQRPEYWKSSAILWFLEHYGKNDPENAIKDCARLLLSEISFQKPPVKLKSLFPQRKIISAKFGNLSVLSQLLPISGGFSIILDREQFQNKGSSYGRFRFSVAHEIGHTFFYDLNTTVPTRPKQNSGSQAEERLCDIFAAELLMPEEKIKRDSIITRSEFGSWCETLVKIHSLYEVSMEALVRRVLELNIIQDAIIVNWRYKMPTKSKANSAEKRLRVELCLPLLNDKYRYLWNDRPAPKDSIFTEALKVEKTLHSKEYIKLDRLDGTFQIESRRYNSGISNTPNSVLSIIWT